MAFSLDQKALNDLLDRFVQLESQQEKLKADLHQTSADQTATRKALLSEFGRWTSVLEGHLGKNSANPVARFACDLVPNFASCVSPGEIRELTEFGIAPRQLRPHKGPRTPASSEA